MPVTPDDTQDPPEIEVTEKDVVVERSMVPHQIIRDINELFSDTSVSLEIALERQEQIRDAAQMNIDALKDDIKTLGEDAG